MPSVLLKFLAIVALVSMSFGMTDAPALAQPAVSHQAVADTGHCDEQSDRNQSPDAKMECMAMCASLAAGDGPVLAAQPLRAAFPVVSSIRPFAGVLLEIATPPPRQGLTFAN